MKKLLLATVFSFAAGAVTQAASIDTTPFWDGNSTIEPFGNPIIATVGETFRAPAATLNSFTFFIDTNGSNITFKAQVFVWDGPLLGGGGGATGPALFTGPSTTINAIGFQAVTTNTGSLALSTGQAYVALLTVSNPADFAATDGYGFWAGMDFHPAAAAGDGGSVYFNNGDNPGLLNTSAWDTYADDGSSAWTATFANASTDVPEPASLALLGAGLLGLGIARRKRA